MKKILFFLLAVLLSFPVFARDFKYTYNGKTLTYTVLDEDAKTVKTKDGSKNFINGSYLHGNEVTGKLEIPSKVIDGNAIYTVTAIGKYSFGGQIESVTIPSSVTSIGFDAFGRTGWLSHAEFASIESLCSIRFDDYYSNPLSLVHKLFIGGEEIKELSIPSTVTSIGDYAFAGCSGLTSVSIPGSVTSIGSGAFKGCSGLTSVTIPESVTSIDDYAFQECRGLTNAEFASIKSLCSIRFGNEDSNPLYLTHNLFIAGEEIKELRIPSTVTSIGAYAFAGCSGLTSVTIPESVTLIGSDTFWGCSGLTSVSIPKSVTLIGNYAFAGCSGLTSVTIPGSVTSIGSGAFARCSGLTSVTIPESVTSIDDYAFQECRGLTNAEFASIKSLCSIRFGNEDSNPLYLTHNLFIAGEEIKELSIPSTVTSIGNYAFYRCNGLTSVTIPESVTSIGNYAFAGCSGLTSVSIPGSVTSIGSGAFTGCSGLTSVTIPESVTSIEYGAFWGCSGLTSIYYGADNPIQGDLDIFRDDTYRNCTLYLSEKGLEKGKSIVPWGMFDNIQVYDFPTGVSEISSDFDENEPYEVFSLDGIKVADSADGLAPGTYVLRQGKTSKKIMVK